MSSTTIPADFWGQIRHQLERIADPENPADTFAKVRAILTDPAYAALDGYGYDKGHQFPENRAFFAGGGGDDTLFDALYEAGWYWKWVQAEYYYAAFHKQTGGMLTYIEGDVIEGDASLPSDPA